MINPLIAESHRNKMIHGGCFLSRVPVSDEFVDGRPMSKVDLFQDSSMGIDSCDPPLELKAIHIWLNTQHVVLFPSMCSY